MDLYSAGPTGGKGRGYIPPPPTANFESGGEYDPFPGATQPNYTSQPPPTVPGWLAPAPASPSPWAPNWPYPRPGNYSPYSHPTPAASFGELSPASRVINTPGGGGYHAAGLGQPITPSPWFNAGGNRGMDPGWNVGYDGPLERRHSNDSPPHSPWHYPVGYPLMRSLSTGSGNRAGSYHEYDSDYLARRPRDYRPGFESRWKLTKVIPIHIPGKKPRSEVPEFKDPVKRTVNELLQYKRPVTDILLDKVSDIYISYDLRYPPNLPALTFPHLRRPANNLDFAQLATNPPAERMRLFHPLLPWYIEVQQSQANGVTVSDVLVQMFHQLQQQIRERDYFNEELDSAARERIARAFELRTKDSEEERAMGVKWVDYLEDKVVFVGLVRTWGRRWEMKTVAQEMSGFGVGG